MMLSLVQQQRIALLLVGCWWWCSILYTSTRSSDTIVGSTGSVTAFTVTNSNSNYNRNTIVTTNINNNPTTLTTKTTSSSSTLLYMSSSSSSSTTSIVATKSTDDMFEIEFTLPPKNSGLVVQMKIKPILSIQSQLIIVRYAIPFGLDIQPKKGYAVCTKDSTVSDNGGGEKMNDILRYSSQYTLGLPRGDGIQTTAASFAGGVSWQCSMFDVIKAKAWEQVIAALTSNTPQRTDEVILIFERSLDPTIVPPELQ